MTANKKRIYKSIKAFLLINVSVFLLYLFLWALTIDAGRVLGVMWKTLKGVSLLLLIGIVVAHFVGWSLSSILPAAIRKSPDDREDKPSDEEAKRLTSMPRRICFVLFIIFSGLSVLALFLSVEFGYSKYRDMATYPSTDTISDQEAIEWIEDHNLGPPKGPWGEREKLEPRWRWKMPQTLGDFLAIKQMIINERFKPRWEPDKTSKFILIAKDSYKCGYVDSQYLDSSSEGRAEPIFVDNRGKQCTVFEGEEHRRRYVNHALSSSFPLFFIALTFMMFSVFADVTYDIYSITFGKVFSLVSWLFKKFFHWIRYG